MQAGSLIVTVFGDAVLPRGGRLWLGSLIRLLEPMGLSERLVRTAVFRLVKDEWLATEAVGRRADYFLTEAGRHRFDEAARQIYAAHAPGWDRRWRLLLPLGDLSAVDRDKLRRALFWHGFGDLGSAGFVHPGAELSDVLEALTVEGLGPLVSSLRPLLAEGVASLRGASDRQLVQDAWDLADLAAGYQAFVARYAPIREEWCGAASAAPDDDLALQVRLLLIHDYRRLLLRDPELPEVLLPADWPGREARRLCAEVYRGLLVPSERALDRQLRLADGSVPARSGELGGRFHTGQGKP